MLRLFLFIFSAVIITLFGVNFSLSFVAKKIEKTNITAFYEDAFSGVFMLLDDALNTTDKASLEASEKHIRSLFKFPVSLEKLENLSLPQSSVERLNAGKMAFSQENGADYLYQKSKRSEGIWVAAAELNEYDANVALVEGPINLILMQIENLSPAEQAIEIKAFSAASTVPVSLTEITDLDLSTFERTQLLNGKVVGKNAGYNGERYFKKMTSSDAILQLGPIPFPAILGVLTPVLLGLFFLLLAIACSLWLRPLWHDLRQLMRASDTIASGQLSARIQPKSLSIIRPVIDGFNRMAEQTERTIESQQALTNAVSHELRTPLARVKFSLEMARQASHTPDRERHLDDISTDVGELNQLVEELLTFTRHDRADNQFDADLFPSINVETWLLEQVSRANRGLAKNITLHHSISISDFDVARFHSRLMSYAVSNGISNAARFTKTRVDVSLTCEGADYILCIDDDGPGIPLEMHSTVFDPFHRLDESRNRESGGFGLGLSIIKKVAEWHNGSATLATSGLGGNQLMIRWPVVQLTDHA